MFPVSRSKVEYLLRVINAVCLFYPEEILKVEKDGVTYGTSLKCVGVQIVSLNSEAGVDTGDMNTEDVAALFGNTQGFKANEPNVTVRPDEDEVDF